MKKIYCVFSLILSIFTVRADTNTVSLDDYLIKSGMTNSIQQTNVCAPEAYLKYSHKTELTAYTNNKAYMHTNYFSDTNYFSVVFIVRNKDSKVPSYIDYTTATNLEMVSLYEPIVSTNKVGGKWIINFK